jgi:hypothetical protein
VFWPDRCFLSKLIYSKPVPKLTEKQNDCSLESYAREKAVQGQTGDCPSQSFSFQGAIAQRGRSLFGQNPICNAQLSLKIFVVHL